MLSRNVTYIKGTTADGSTVGKDLLYDFERVYVNIQFFSDSTYTTKVTPTAGTVSIQGSPTPGSWFVLNNGDFNAADTDTVTRGMPNGLGPCNQVKIVLNGITGATHFIAMVAKF